MKRMYVVLSVILLVFVWAVTSLGQKISEPADPHGFDRLKRRMELREEMHRRMRDKILYGRGGEDIFQGMDRLMEDAMKDSFADFDALSVQGSNFQSEWLENGQGRVLVITPKDKDQELNIDVNADMITIKGKTEQKSGNSSFMSSFSNSFPVPHDTDGTKVKMDHKDGKILIELPFRKATKIVTPPPKDERRPLPPSEGDVTI